jgi:tyrosyl-tRNA synthetase
MKMPIAHRLDIREKRYMGIIDLLVGSGMCCSKGEAKRLIRAGAVEINGLRVRDIRALVEFRL